MLAVLWAGFACGVLDITAALVVYGFFGAKPVASATGIASGLLGPKAFNGGLATALLGLLCHFVIAFGAAAVYFVASRALPFLIQNAVASLRRAVWRGRLFLHESHCVAAVRCRQASVFSEVDDCRRGHTHLLCRTSHISQRPPIFQMTCYSLGARTPS